MDQERQSLPPSYGRWPGLSYDPVSGAINSDDSQFDIFDVPSEASADDRIEIPLHDLAPWSDFRLNAAMLDIETVGADGGPCRFDGTDVIVAIGLKCRGNYYVACNAAKSEFQLLGWFYDRLSRLYADGITHLVGHNIYGFDLGVLADRSKFHGLASPWKRRGGKYSAHRWSGARVFGKALELQAWNCPHFELIDTYPQVVLYDAIVSKLESNSLKDAVIGFGLRADRRLEIGAEVYKYWAEGDEAKIAEYLRYDLDDTELLWDFLIPQSYYQGQYLPWTLTRTTTTGTGSWWDKYLRYLTGVTPTPTECASYQGALTYYHSGIYSDCAKLDFASLYPSITLTYRCHGGDDVSGVALAALANKLQRRRDLKRQMKSAVGYEYRDLDGQQAATKRLANSLYGLWNTQGLGFNDPYAGAAITAYGRQLARYMIKFAVDRGCDCVAIDTDGALFRIAPHIVGNYPDIDSKIKFFAELTADLNAKLPGTTAVEFEDYIPSLYIPPSDKSGAATVLARKIEFLDSRVKPDDLSPGLSKNYLMTTLDRGRYEHTGEFVTKMVRKGKFKKRDKSWLEAGMIIAWFEVYNSSGNEAASKFLDDVRAQIASGAFPVENLRKTVLVAATWKAFPAAGFPVGTKPTIHYAWLGETTGVRNKKVYTPVADPAIPYALEYYLEVFDKVTSAIPGYAAKPSSSSISLPLFSIDITV